MLALKLQFELAAAVRAHGLDRVTGHSILPPLPPIDGEVTLTGYAMVWNVTDHERMVFQRNSLTWERMPPLHWRHDETRTIGTVTSLVADVRGLKATVTTAHPLAKNAGGFSIGCGIDRYQICGAGTDNVHAVVHAARLCELSITDRPANAQALVQHRWPVSAHAKMLGHGIRAFELIAQVIRLQMGARA
jgi:phage head maturation protease